MSYRDFMARGPTEGASPPDGLAPPWLLRPNGAAFLGALGDGLDALAGSAKEAVKARLPLLGPADALPQIGAERGINRGPNETVASYRARLVAAWDLWQYGGTPRGLLGALFVAGYTSSTIQTQTGYQYSLDSGGNVVSATIPGTVHLGGSPAELWNDVAIFIGMPWPSWWSGTAPADNTAEVDFLRQIVRTWKPAHSRVVQFKAIGGAAWGVNMTWGSFTWGGGTIVTWTPPS